MNSYHKGKWAELLARLYFLSRGYRPVARNYITGRGTTAGEIDLIVKRGRQLIFVEVKQRQTLDTAAYAILPTQQQRIIRGAQSFLQHYPQYQNCQMRFDCFLVTLPWHIRHIKNAWTM